MTIIYEQTFNQQRLYFEKIFAITHKEGQQTYLFYTMSANNAHRIGMIEILIDEELSDEEQLVFDRGELQVPSNVGESSRNNGPINIGGGYNYLLTSFE